MKLLQELNTPTKAGVIPLKIVWHSRYNGFSLDVDWENAPYRHLIKGAITRDLEDVLEELNDAFEDFMPDFDSQELANGYGEQKFIDAANTMIKKKSLGNMKVVSFEEDPHSS